MTESCLMTVDLSNQMEHNGRPFLQTNPECQKRSPQRTKQQKTKRFPLCKTYQHLSSGCCLAFTVSLCKRPLRLESKTDSSVTSLFKKFDLIATDSADCVFDQTSFCGSLVRLLLTYGLPVTKKRPRPHVKW